MPYRVLAIRGKPDPFLPREYQSGFMGHVQAHSRADPARALAVWPRRSGKDLTALHSLTVMAHEVKGMYWHCLPTYEQGRKACWLAFRGDTGDRLMDNVFPREIVYRPRQWGPNQEMVIELKCGSIIQFVGSDSIDRLVGSGIKGVNFSEFSLSKPTAWPLIRPMLNESGGWATFLFTPRGRNHAHKLFEMARQNKNWLASYRDLYSIGVYPKEEVDALLHRERAEGMPEELVRQEYLCDFTAALVGSYFGDLLEKLEHNGGLNDFEHERDGIYAVFDLGMSDSTAIWFFRLTSGGCDFVHYYESNGKPLSHYFDWMEEQSRLLGFEYRALYFPHDARARHLTGATVMEAAVERWGIQMVRKVPQVSFLDGVQAGRKLLQAETRFHPRVNQYNGLEVLRQYHKAWDEDKKCFGLHPEHDWSSHGADAFRYAGCIMYHANLLKPKSKPVVHDVYTPIPPQQYSIDQLLKLRKPKGTERA